MKYTIYSIIASIALSLTSCDFLNVTDVGKSDVETFFADVDGLRAASVGSYNTLADLHDTYFGKYPEIAADMLYLSIGQADMIEQYNYTSSPEDESTGVGFIWRKGYTVIANANNILEYSPKLESKYPNELAEIHYIQAQALFMRALAHIDLCLCYGQPYNYTSNASHLGVCVLTRLPGGSDKIMRSSVREVYERAITDLNDAINLFGSYPIPDIYHVSPLACKALLARLYLYMGDYNNAQKYASEVIEASSLTPRSEYVNMFTTVTPGKETIFRINGYGCCKALGKFYDPTSPIAYPADKIYTYFKDNDDVRLQLLYFNNKKACMKYYVTGTSAENSYYSPMVLRASEMYLIRAEAYCQLGNNGLAVADIKTLEDRATGKSVTLSYNNTDDVIALIKAERIKELCYEGHRLFDILRYKDDLVRDANTTSSVITKSYPNDWFVLPIPQAEIEANTAIQPNPTVNN